MSVGVERNWCLTKVCLVVVWYVVSRIEQRFGLYSCGCLENLMVTVWSILVMTEVSYFELV